ncbi:uncharacterized protein LOC143854284 [Tasmannia lanceolata]|uniref:uncharacterized protein LOC143854284 n=1 Tax=Tasmannia lanceolata TaxID=3420 RepID=UPI0040636892
MADNTPSQVQIDEHFNQYQQQINEFRLLQSQQHGELVAMLKQLQLQSQATLLHRPTSEETSSGDSSAETVPLHQKPILITGHDCRTRLYHLEAIDENPDCLMEDDNDEILEDTSTETLGDKPAEISFPALVGQQNPSTIPLTRVSTNHSLHVLIDNGSTHNFVKDQVAKIIKLPIVPPTPFRVLIGNGESLLCPKKCLDVKLNLQTPEFQFDLVLLPIKGADVILGIQWLEELQAVLECSSAHKLFAKLSKCQFCQNMLDYLGHLLSGLGLQSDPDKVQAMQHWTWPSSLKHLCGFVGLTGYYRQFIRHYVTVASPLTDLLQKDAFPWSSEAQKAFAHSKKCLRTMFEALYGRKPPTIPLYNSGSSSIEAVEDDLPQRDQILIRLKYTLHQSQARMSCLAD